MENSSLQEKRGICSGSEKFVREYSDRTMGKGFHLKEVRVR